MGCNRPADVLPKCKSPVAAMRTRPMAATYVPSWHLSCLRTRVTPGHISTPSRHASEFYKKVLESLQTSNIEFLVGGAFAFVRYTGIDRDTKDLDLFVR